MNFNHDVLEKISILHDTYLAELLEFLEFLNYKQQNTIQQQKQLAPQNAAKVFFTTHAPLQSFRTEDPAEYVQGLRQNSRILSLSERMDES